MKEQLGFSACAYEQGTPRVIPAQKRMTVLQTYKLPAQAVGGFAELITELEEAKTKKEKLRLETMVSGFVRSMVWIRDKNQIKGRLVSIQKTYHLTGGDTVFSFIFLESLPYEHSPKSESIPSLPAIPLNLGTSSEV